MVRLFYARIRLLSWSGYSTLILANLRLPT